MWMTSGFTSRLGSTLPCIRLGGINYRGKIERYLGKFFKKCLEKNQVCVWCHIFVPEARLLRRRSMPYYYKQKKRHFFPLSQGIKMWQNLWLREHLVRPANILQVPPILWYGVISSVISISDQENVYSVWRGIGTSAHLCQGTWPTPSVDHRPVALTYMIGEQGYLSWIISLKCDSLDSLLHIYLDRK